MAFELVVCSLFFIIMVNPKSANLRKIVYYAYMVLMILGLIGYIIFVVVIFASSW